MGREEVLKVVKADDDREYTFAKRDIKLPLRAYLNPANWKIRKHRFVQYFVRGASRWQIIGELIIDMHELFGHALRIRRKYQNIHLGTALLVIMAEDLKSQGFSRIKADTLTAKTAGFFRRRGANIIEGSRRYYIFLQLNDIIDKFPPDKLKIGSIK